MMSQQYDKLNPHEKIMFGDIARNPAYLKVLENEKLDLEKSILTFARFDKESETSVCRRLENLHVQYSTILHLIELNNSINNSKGEK